MRKNCGWWPIAVGFLLFAGSVCPSRGATVQERGEERGGPVVTVGDPNHPDSLSQDLVDAYTRGSKRINIRPGVYRFSHLGHATIEFSHWKDVKLGGHGVTLVCAEGETAPILKLSDCSKVEIDELTLSSADPAFYQGRVTSVSITGAGSTACTWTPDSGFPLPAWPAGSHQALWAVDRKTQKLKTDCGHLPEAMVEPLSGPGYRVTFAGRGDLVEGDCLVASGVKAQPGSSRVDLDNCRECIVAEVTLLLNGAVALQEHGGGGNVLYGCHWGGNSKLIGKGEKPLVCCAGTAFESTGAYPGPDIEGCDFTGVVLGDGFSVAGSLNLVKRVEGGAVIIGTPQDKKKFQVGRPVRFASPGFFANAFVKSVQTLVNGDLKLTLDRDVAVPTGARVSDPLYNGQSFKLLGCHFGNATGNGVVTGADSVLIQGNTIAGCGGAAVVAGPNYQIDRADFVQDLSIKNNQISKCGFLSGVAAIDIQGKWAQGESSQGVGSQGEGSQGNQDVTVESNLFDSDFSEEIRLTWTHGAEIRGNTFSAPPAAYGMKAHPIFLENSQDIRITRNSYKLSSGYETPFVQLGTGVEGVKSDGSN